MIIILGTQVSHGCATIPQGITGQETSFKGADRVASRRMLVVLLRRRYGEILLNLLRIWSQINPLLLVVRMYSSYIYNIYI